PVGSSVVVSWGGTGGGRRGGYDRVEGAKRACLNGKRAFSGNSGGARKSGFLAAPGQCRQGVQRLWKRLHRDDRQPVRLPSRIGCVLPSRHEEGVHTRL